ncbi:hypothetical protein DL89DRAFT_266900 [Linderina pennispora]|uniref:Uncharacterized protein n=1 Tax=Linderina pennispora TaxID=61395 RepID=A0A1Y1WBE1_9FUNG|nr:uncharacterized protein DL89DRAFT_266900 [Linderina pennispora]ORX70762.1 hypothetical protein DL89DRAFT_266900 [Linderina pennispora]
MQAVHPLPQPRLIGLSEDFDKFVQKWPVYFKRREKAAEDNPLPAVSPSLEGQSALQNRLSGFAGPI